MRILFCHANFPGQFKHLAPALAQMGHDVRALTMNPPPSAPFLIEQAPLLRGNPPGLDPWLLQLDSKLIRGRSALPVLQKWKQNGWQPDVVVGHSGWGDMLFVREIFPQARVLGLFEFYYHTSGHDVGFDSEFPLPVEDRSRVRLKNLWPLWMLEQVDLGYCPTRYQRDVHPEVYHHKLEVVHEGIDTETLCPNPQMRVTLEGGLTLTCQDEVITFVNRNLEPYRGYHIFMRSLPEILARRPKAHVLVAGADGVGYGAAPKEGENWKQIFLDEVSRKLDMTRVHFLGRVPYRTLVGLFQLSGVHIYLSYPFVLSWSMLEAMSCGALVVGSGTAPVREVIRHGENGLLVDFFDAQALAGQVCQVLARPEKFQALRQKARSSIVKHYDLKGRCLPKQLELIDRLGKNKA